MTRDDLMTYGALGFAVVAAAVYLRAKKAPSAVATTPGEQQRVDDLHAFNQQQMAQWEHVQSQAASETPQTAGLLFNALP